MNLSIGSKIYRLKRDTLSTTNHVIRRVAALAKKGKARKELVFENMNIIPWEDVNYGWVYSAFNEVVYHSDIETVSYSNGDNSNGISYVHGGVENDISDDD